MTDWIHESIDHPNFGYATSDPASPRFERFRLLPGETVEDLVWRILGYRMSRREDDPGSGETEQG